MKSTIIMCATGFVVATAMMPPAQAALPICMSSTNCMAFCKAGNYCCLTGETGTEKTCPSDWSLSLDKSTCTRTATTGSDAKGYYTQNYGTCDPDITTYNCYKTSAIPSANVIDCMTCVS